MRCNVGIDPSLLTDQHVIAEYRELPMVVGSLRSNGWMIKSAVPEKFNLGIGHINFLKNKLYYLERRHDTVKIEMYNRGFKQTSLSMDINLYREEFCNNWHPTLEDSMVIRKRIKEKLANPELFGFWRLRRKVLTVDELVQLSDRILTSELFEV